MKPNEISDSDVRSTDISVRSALSRVRWNDMPVRRIDISVRSPERSVRYSERSVRCSDSPVRCDESWVRKCEYSVDAWSGFIPSTTGSGGTGAGTVRCGRMGALSVDPVAICVSPQARTLAAAVAPWRRLRHLT